jgi:hypothetical protein
MFDIITALEPRLHRRYLQLVMEHLSPAHQLATGLRSLPRTAQAFASTQAAWRFWRNQRVSLKQLLTPLIAAARQQIPQTCQNFVLCVHDWTVLTYTKHGSKKERKAISGRATALGYELQTALLISDTEGDPLSVAAQSLFIEEALLTTREAEEKQPLAAQIDEVAEQFQAVEKMNLPLPVVHLVDRALDSVFHYREFCRRDELFVIRADALGRVEFQGQQIKLGLVAAGVDKEFCAEVLFKGKKQPQFVGETRVRLTRAARPQRQNNGVKQARRVIKGEALELRLIVSEIRDENEQVLAQWLLLSNLEETVRGAQIAQWYYYRWRIESFFKLLKSAGQELENWQQQEPGALLRRLLVASMACVVVWQLQRAQSESAREARQLLVRLSGRQMKWGCEATAPALFAGLWSLLAMLDVLENYSLSEIRKLTEVILPPQLRSG